ncbi:MAG: DUF4878 domain-containing protein [Firmicutes bacterium]|nr:DUF4878 domain-containing protein [Bacillota bacterium]
MKKSLLFVFIAIMAAGILVAGCGGKSPETVVKEFTTAMKAGDWEKAALCLENEDTTILQKDVANEEEEKIAKQILAQATFEVGSATITGEQAIVNVKVTSIDMIRIVTGMMTELMSFALSSAFDGSGENQDNIDAMADQYLKNSISDPNAPKTTTDTTVNLIKIDGAWKISADNNEFLDALMGNIGKAFPE